MMEGKLCVSVIEARNLLADMVAELKFYVKLRLGTSEVKTDTVHSAAPKFLKDIRMGVPAPEKDVLRIELLQAGPRGDLVIGTGQLPVNSITSKGTVVHWFQLQSLDGEVTAELCLVLRYLQVGGDRPMTPSYAIAARQARERALEPAAASTPTQHHRASAAPPPFSTPSLPSLSPATAAAANWEQKGPSKALFHDLASPAAVATAPPAAVAAAVDEGLAPVTPDRLTQVQPQAHTPASAAAAAAAAVPAAAAATAVSEAESPAALPLQPSLHTPAAAPSSPAGAAAAAAAGQQQEQKRKQGSSSRRRRGRHGSVPLPLALASGVLIGALVYLFKSRPMYIQVPEGGTLCAIGGCYDDDYRKVLRRNAELLRADMEAARRVK